MRSVDHTSFVIHRMLNGEPARCFRAFSQAEAKRQWFSCDERMETAEYSLDCRPGGSEINRVRLLGGEDHLYLAHYFDVVPDHRILFGYSMHVGDRRLSASLVTITFQPRGEKTLMTYTEQVAMLDGLQEVEERIRGTELGLDNLERKLPQL
ncbi:SRPBCC family protein [Roseibium salinum]|uniref:SRPBCC family protein n=1 Tax=Roseibium salinum TaxID=1604349 RepID=A0ABT3QXX5_9HYPH|nr:SRPBCC family protein [Roseibium sp. DSM 29163]MCX2721794.1 SRPBCC family protein [Roseibium sp. DSM 29163]